MYLIFNITIETIKILWNSDVKMWFYVSYDNKISKLLKKTYVIKRLVLMKNKLKESYLIFKIREMLHII